MKKIPENGGETIQNEVKILSNINSDFIVKYYNSFIEKNNLYIIMEYCDNIDLRNFINVYKKIIN